jgi:hypothetical protein
VLSADGCSQICRRASEEETVRRDSFPATRPMLGGEAPPISVLILPQSIALCYQNDAASSPRWHFLPGGFIPLPPEVDVAHNPMLSWLVLSCYTLVELC